MELNQNLLKEAAKHGLISDQQADQLWTFLRERGQDTPSFQKNYQNTNKAKDQYNFHLTNPCPWNLSDES